MCERNKGRKEERGERRKKRRCFFWRNQLNFLGRNHCACNMLVRRRRRRKKREGNAMHQRRFATKNSENRAQSTEEQISPVTLSFCDDMSVLPLDSFYSQPLE